VALTKKRFELTFQTRLAEIIYRRPWPIGVDRLVPMPMTMSPTPPPPVASRSK
jgi:hypothetical protein